MILEPLFGSLDVDSRLCQEFSRIERPRSNDRTTAGLGEAPLEDEEELLGTFPATFFKTTHPVQSTSMTSTYKG